MRRSTGNLFFCVSKRKIEQHQIKEPRSSVEFRVNLNRDIRICKKIVYAPLKEQAALTINSGDGFRTLEKYCDLILVKG